MKNNHDVWQTLYEHDFNRQKYLYHYTDFCKAVKILSGNSLKFSKLSATNDTVESKIKISFKNKDERDSLKNLVEILESANKKYLQLLCMSMDSEGEFSSENERTINSDYSGRGFALPRMWAQYADNNHGVCLIFEKNILSEIIQEAFSQGKSNTKNSGPKKHLLHEDVVDYVCRYSNKSYSDIFKDTVKSNDKCGKTDDQNIALSILSKNEEFIKYNYFIKHEDWINENEYRYLAHCEEDIFIPGITDALAGIVIGEYIDKEYINVFEKIDDNYCDIMKITFEIGGCRLKSIY